MRVSSIPTSLLRGLLAAGALAAFAGCATAPISPTQSKDAAAEQSLRDARSARLSTEQRAANYLRAAELTAPLVATAPEAAEATRIYNAATAELTVLLRSAKGGTLWNRPLIASGNGVSYQLRFQPGSKNGVWAPDYFTAFKPVREVNETLVQKPNLRAGVGGVLVGVHKTEPREEFATLRGIAGAVTATLEFQGHTATLVLNDPTKLATVRLSGKARPLAADFSAPFCFYPAVDQFWLGLQEGLRPGRYTDKEGIFLLQPYDPNRIPVFYIHGLISTPYIWRDPINQINEDPELRAKYQAIVFGYPTGNPVAYSALHFREDLAKFAQRYPMPHGFVLVAHSLGGLVAQMQTETITRADWHRTMGAKADALFARVTPDSEISRALTFNANPKAKRVVFIATPHLGADMAVDSIGKLAMRLIRLPNSVTNTLRASFGNTLEFVTGGSRFLPTSISSLAPDNPTLHVLASEKVVPPCHSIIGNRGKPGPLAQSSDGIVPYWSSHLDYAKSEVIVPGPHSCYDYPQSIKEMKRILHLHLTTTH